MEVQIAAEQAYLNDAEIWVRASIAAADGTELAVDNANNQTITEMAGLIQSIEVLADSQQLCIISDARYLLSIMNQRKPHGSEEQLHFKKDLGEE